MTNQSEFKAAAQKALDGAVAWREDGPKVPAAPPATTQELRALFDIGLPDEGRDGAEIIDNLIAAGSKGLVPNTHPNFFAWVMGASHPIGVAADILTSAWGQNAGIYRTAPAAAIAEEIAAKWLLDLLRLPHDASIAFATGATMASFICLSTARNEVLKRAGYDLEEDGIIGAPKIHVFLGREAHATIHTDLQQLGFGRKNLIEIETDDEGRMRAPDFKAKIAKYPGPKIVITQAGHINSGAFDPVGEITAVAHAHNAWVHVDGAFGLWVRAVPQLAHLGDGIETADSWTADGHKWLQIPYDSGFAIIRNEQAHRRTMGITASYIASNADDGRNPSDYAPELSRRARGFAVWAVLQALGRNGIEEMIWRHCRCTQHLKARLKDVSGIRILNEVAINQMAVAFGGESEPLETRNAMTRRVLYTLREEDRNFVLGATWKDQEILRVSVISRQTDIADMDVLAESILTAWDAVQIGS
jgi:glutamate/tyrosine decarboxylase-like PLP-dependent enzyme